MKLTLPIVLIGPMAAGKTTIARILEQKTGVRNVPMDMVRWYYYFKDGYSAAHDHGLKTLVEKADYWKRFDLLSVERILSDFKDAIIDLGAGHSYYPDPDELKRAQTLLAPLPNVFLLLPSLDPVISDKACRERIKAVYPAVTEDELSINQIFLHHHSNKFLAKHTVTTLRKTPEAVADELLSLMC